MSSSKTNTVALEQQILTLQEEVELLQKSNADLEIRLEAFSFANSGQTSLINELINKVPFGVMILNENQKITQANKAAENILSVSVEKLEGMSCKELFEGVCSIDDDSSNPQILLLNNGKHIMHNTFSSDEGSQKIFIKSFVDISEIKLAEEELIKVNQTKDEFLGMISHELRTPLNVIQGYGSLLEDEVRNIENTDASSYVQHITKAGEMLLQVVSNLLDLSGLTAGKVNVDMIPIDLEMIVTQLQYRLEKLVAEEGNKLIFEYEDIPPFEQDLALLMKLLYELLVNANKFTEAGEVRVSIAVENKDKKDWLRFEISDSGCGMTEETMKQIFNAFHQADSSLTRAHEGLGLGLSLVEKIVKIIKGTIEVKSEIGVGSTFAVLFPYNAYETG